MVTSVSDRAAIWRRYEQWNAALAAVAAEQGEGGQPLYLQLDDEVLQAAVSHLGEDVKEPRRQLVALVRSTMDIGPDAPPLKAHAARARFWEPANGDPPPCIALLYVCSAAAMEMRAGGGMNSRNYYGRLGALLGLSTEDIPELTRGYRIYAEVLWGALNRWLEHHEGEKGLPTAFALRHRYAGLPMSQALVRRADRAKLTRFFASYGLPPHGQMSPTDLEPLLDDWVNTNPCPVSLFMKDLWEREGEARERIASIVSLELAEWEGGTDLPATDAARSGALRLVATIRSFPTRRLRLDLSVRLAHDSDEALFDVVDASGAVMQKILFTRAGDGSLIIAPGHEVDPTALVAGFTRLRGPGAAGERKPRLLVPLRWDDLLQAFVETERVQLSETCMLMVPANRASDVSAALSQCAAPGWEQIDAMAGLPEAWVLFTGVEIFAPLDRSRHPWIELDALVPLGTTQLSLAGGLRLPTKLRKWSTFSPPEIRAVLSEAEQAEVTVRSLGDDGWAESWASSDGVILVNLGEIGLSDGDYSAQLRVGGKKDPVAESIIRLRSADTPNRLPPEPDLGYGSDGTAAFSATEEGPLRGATGLPSVPSEEQGRGPRPPSQLHALTVRRVRTRVEIPPRPLVLGEVREDSCVATGAHRIELPPVMGPARRGWVQGTCRACGLVKRYPATHWQARKRQRRAAGGRRDPVDLSRLRPVQGRDEVDWQLGLDALCHLGRGAGTALDRVGLQIEPSKLFVDAFTRTLVGLGYLDAERSPRTWRVERWQVPPPALVHLQDGDWFLTGWRSERLVHGLAVSAVQVGAELDISTEHSAPDALLLRHAEAGMARRIAQLVDVPGHHLRVEEDIPQRVLMCVPPLAQVAAALPRVVRGDVRKVEVWDPGDARWVEAEHPRSGFLRLHGAVRTYCMITSADMRDGMLRPMTPQLLKHVAGALTGRPLIAWDSTTQVLSVPKGCDLPGLMGRAVTLCSGRPPRLSEDGQVLMYKDVPEIVAREVHARLGGSA